MAIAFAVTLSQGGHSLSNRSPFRTDGVTREGRVDSAVRRHTSLRNARIPCDAINGVQSRHDADDGYAVVVRPNRWRPKVGIADALGTR